MKTAKVSELKAKLSAYLRAVRQGETVVVCDRLTPIAKLAPIEPDGGGLLVSEPRTAGRGRRKVRPVRLRRRVDMVELLRASRDQR
jgi:prevent-host-death family protein